MFFISLAYMLTKVLMRPLRSLTLDYWALKKETKKHIHIITYAFAIVTFGTAYFLSIIPPFLTVLGFIYFSLLMFWNAGLLSSKFIVLLNISSLIFIVTKLDMLFLAISFIVLFFSLITLKNRQPRNIVKRLRNSGYEYKFILSFKENTNWDQIARRYPEIIWLPLGKKLCLIDITSNIDVIESFIYQKSFDLTKIEPLSIDLAKRHNIR